MSGQVVGRNLVITLIYVGDLADATLFSKKIECGAAIITGDSDCGAKLRVLLTADLLECGDRHALGEELAHGCAGLDTLMLALVTNQHETLDAQFGGGLERLIRFHRGNEARFIDEPKLGAVR